MDNKMLMVLISELLSLAIDNTEGLVRAMVMRVETLLEMLEGNLNNPVPEAPKPEQEKQYYFSLRFGGWADENKQKIALIKTLRQHTNLGLKEAKELVEECLFRPDDWVSCWEGGWNLISEEQGVELCDGLREINPYARVKIYKVFGT